MPRNVCVDPNLMLVLTRLTGMSIKMRKLAARSNLTLNWECSKSFRSYYDLLAGMHVLGRSYKVRFILGPATARTTRTVERYQRA